MHRNQQVGRGDAAVQGRCCTLALEMGCPLMAGRMAGCWMQQPKVHHCQIHSKNGRHPGMHAMRADAAGRHCHALCCAAACCATAPGRPWARSLAIIMAPGRFLGGSALGLAALPAPWAWPGCCRCCTTWLPCKPRGTMAELPAAALPPSAPAVSLPLPPLLLALSFLTLPAGGGGSSATPTCAPAAGSHTGERLQSAICLPTRNPKRVRESMHRGPGRSPPSLPPHP